MLRRPWRCYRKIRAPAPLARVKYRKIRAPAPLARLKYCVIHAPWHVPLLGGRIYTFLRVLPLLGGRRYAFLRGIHKSGWQNVCIFTWYPQVWVAECIHFCMVSASLGGRMFVFYVVSASLGGRMYAFLRGICKSRWQNVCIFYVVSATREPAHQQTSKPVNQYTSKYPNLSDRPAESPACKHVCP